MEPGGRRTTSVGAPEIAVAAPTPLNTCVAASSVSGATAWPRAARARSASIASAAW